MIGKGAVSQQKIIRDLKKEANAETKLDLKNVVFVSLCLILHWSTGLPSTELSPCQFATAGSDFQISLFSGWAQN